MVVGDNSRRFIEAYKTIEMYLRKAGNIPDDFSFSKALNEKAEHDRLLRPYRSKLLEYAKLRNVIVHSRTPDGAAIAEPHDSVVEEIESIARMLLDPPKITSLKGGEKVTTIEAKDPIGKALEIIKEKSFSQIPVYSGKEYRGLLTTNAVARWMASASEKERAFIYDCPVERVLSYAEENEDVRFVRGSTNLFEVLEAFGKAGESGKRLEAILVTDSGKRDEKPTRIITIWDIPEINSRLQTARELRS